MFIYHMKERKTWIGTHASEKSNFKWMNNDKHTKFCICQHFDIKIKFYVVGILIQNYFRNYISHLYTHSIIINLISKISWLPHSRICFHAKDKIVWMSFHVCWNCLLNNVFSTYLYVIYCFSMHWLFSKAIIRFLKMLNWNSVEPSVFWFFHCFLRKVINYENEIKSIQSVYYKSCLNSIRLLKC